MKVSRSTVAGALVGCAVGDAIGAPFEGLWAESIPSAESLLAGYHEYHGFPAGQFTDDTQLTVAAIESVVERRGVDLGDIATRIAEYWRHHTVIGPGGACTHAAEHFLATGDWRTMGAPAGQAGNGTAMRTAVLGLLYTRNADRLRDEVAGVSRLTHTDPRSVAGGVAIAEAARRLAVEPSVSAAELCAAAATAAAPIHSDFADSIRQLALRYESDSCLEFVAWAGQERPEFDRPIITPFVWPTVLTALYAVISEPTSWAAAVTRAVCLGGDVDTLGAIVGALAGARHGLSGIPPHLVDSVQASENLHSLAARYHAFLSGESGD